ncbi:MAG: peptidylprolyl isomerase, partial [Bdellovibrionota bacterium]
RIAPSLGEPTPASRRWIEQRMAYAERLTEQILVEHEAKRLSVTVPPEEVEKQLALLSSGYSPTQFEKVLSERGLDKAAWEEDVRNRLLSERTAERALGGAVQEVDDEACKAYYDAHAADFSRPKEVRARQILVSSGAQAEELRAQLRKKADFAELARQYSTAPEAAQGGDLGFFAAGTMPAEFDRVVFQLPVGYVSEIVHSPYGFHLFKVEETRPPRTLSFDEVRGEIRARLERERLSEAYRKWVQELRGKAQVWIDEELLSSDGGQP